MKKFTQFRFLSIILVLAYVLSACAGAPAGVPQQGDDQPQQVVFTGTVDSMGSGQWTISGQAVSVTGTTRVDATVTVGANVKVEAVVDQNGVVTAISIETAGADDANGNDDNSNDTNGNDDNSNDDNSNGNANDDNSNDDNSNGNGDDSASGTESEITGVVQAIAAGTITVNGTEYQIAKFTEFKSIIAVGDQVKAHVLTSADGKQTIREIEKIGGPALGGNDNSNSNSNDDNSNGNSNDDNSNGNGNDDNSNGNDDDSNGNDDNGNDDNGNDGDDDNSNNSNG